MCHQEAHLGVAVLQHMLAVDFTAAPRQLQKLGDFFMGDCRRLGLTGLPFVLQIHVYATLWRRCTRGLWIQCLRGV